MFKNKTSTDLQEQVAILVASILFSVIIGLAPKWVNADFSSAEQIILGLVSFTAFLLVDILWVVSQHSSKQTREHQFWVIRNDGELFISNIRSYYFSIVRDAFGPKDLYTVFFLEEFDRLAHKIKEAAEAQFLRMTENHLFVSAGLFEPSTYGGNDLVIRYTWPISDNEKIFEDYPWRRFFEQLTQAAANGKIKSIKVIVIVTDKKVLEEPRPKLFLDFLHTNKGWDCRVMTAADYRNMCIDSQISQTYLDFGIYGQNLLFRTERSMPTVTGVFTKDGAIIRNYVHFFDTMWESDAITAPNPSTCATQVKLDEFLRFDVEEPV